MRTQNVQGFAGWYLHVGNRQKPLMLAPTLSGGEGSYDWKEVTAEFTAPADADLADLGTVLRGTGTAWFDLVSLECLEGGRLEAVAAKPQQCSLADQAATRWEEPAGQPAPRRAVLRAFNFTPQPFPKTLVSIQAAGVLSRLGVQNRAGRLAVLENGKPIDHALLGDLLLVDAALPARSVRTWHVYGLDAPAASPSPSALLDRVYNLVRNPGFEEGDKSTAEEWTHEGEAAQANGVSFGIDDPGARISANGAHGSMCPPVFPRRGAVGTRPHPCIPSGLIWWRFG